MHDDAISTTPTRTEEDPNLTKRGIYKYNPPIPDDPNSSHYIDHGLPGWLKDSRSGRIHVPVIYDNAVTLDPPAWVWAGKHGPDTPQNQSLEPSPTIERPWTSACLDQTTFDDSTTHAFCPSTLHSTPTVSGRLANVNSGGKTAETTLESATSATRATDPSVLPEVRLKPSSTLLRHQPYDYTNPTRTGAWSTRCEIPGGSCGWGHWRVDGQDLASRNDAAVSLLPDGCFHQDSAAFTVVEGETAGTLRLSVKVLSRSGGKDYHTRQPFEAELRGRPAKSKEIKAAIVPSLCGDYECIFAGIALDSSGSDIYEDDVSRTEKGVIACSRLFEKGQLSELLGLTTTSRVAGTGGIPIPDPLPSFPSPPPPLVVPTTTSRAAGTGGIPIPDPLPSFPSPPPPPSLSPAADSLRQWLANVEQRQRGQIGKDDGDTVLPEHLFNFGIM
jgi:hypothetical protein